MFKANQISEGSFSLRRMLRPVWLNKKIKLKRILFSGIVFLFLLTGSSFKAGQKKYEIKTIVIDAGHGGHDTGCLGSSAKEKDIALDISLKLGKLIQENYPNVKVIYTRKNDVFVELHERAEIANRNKADLFICIHANSGGSAYGTETFVLGLHRAEENLNVSKRENSAILMEKDYKTKYDGFDPNSPEANIIFRLYQSTYLSQSLLFAAKVQDQLNDYAGRLNRGVKQAGLLVLARTSMPGVLIETGFLTNRDEEKYLLSSKGQNQIATAIYRAFKEYKIDMEETPAVGKPAPEKTDSNKADPTKKETLAVVKEEKKPDSSNQRGSQDQVVHAIDPLPPPKKPDQAKPDSAQKQAVAAASTNKTVADTNKSAVKEEAKPKKEEITPVITPSTGNDPEPDEQDVFFTIQVGATDRPSAKDLDRYKKLEDVRERKGEDGMTRYTTGIYFSLDRAILAQNDIRTKGFKDAFVSAYNRDKKITLREATALLQKKQSAGQ